LLPLFGFVAGDFEGGGLFEAASVIPPSARIAARPAARILIL
jgi:hypothetical protein